VDPDDERLSRRERILKRDRYQCVYCGQAFEAADLTLDHVEPQMRGGDDSEGNLVTCCRACNEAKAGAAGWSFLARRPDLRANFMAAVQASDTRFAKPVWNRLLRAIEEAAAADAARRSRK
jgi:CRISPR/Cas system Type II protein with McrA/HNH and RuvC-like nuclease domain